jgi:hypothetical protein
MEAPDRVNFVLDHRNLTVRVRIEPYAQRAEGQPRKGEDNLAGRSSIIDCTPDTLKSRDNACEQLL